MDVLKAGNLIKEKELIVTVYISGIPKSDSKATAAKNRKSLGYSE